MTRHRQDLEFVLGLLAAGMTDSQISRMRETRSFLRGLVHSDGCRVVANDRGVASVRYHFSNRSEDIKSLFCASLDYLGIPWTRPSQRDIAIYRKAAVAQLDEFIGPKE